ncbi:hypothetical protein LMG29660_06886 [Burkholderia puraquae]|uniref:Uncharacterized protein n=1 Tax=Burkholderia puraquae TaxID=1904757 RepID=A0A6J5EZ57_9BURK|nr:hypothetical protein LMG29660_06886 [Burkholderia puraquae]
MLLAWGDVVHVAAIRWQDPAATGQYDSDADAARRTRRDALERVADRRHRVGAAHIAFPGLGHLRQDGERYDWVPLNDDAAPLRQGAIRQAAQPAQRDMPRRHAPGGWPTMRAKMRFRWLWSAKPQTTAISASVMSVVSISWRARATRCSSSH